MKTFYVYRITNKLSGQHYYGVRGTIDEPRFDLGVKYYSSSKYVKEDIERYGKDNFKFKVVRCFDNDSDAIKFECRIHRKFDVSNHPYFYNKVNAKETRLDCSEEHHNYLSKVFKQRMEEMTPEERSLKYGSFGEDNPFYGKRHSKEVQDQIAQKNREWHKTHDNPFLGKTHSRETKEKITKESTSKIYIEFDNGDKILYNGVESVSKGLNISVPQAGKLCKTSMFENGKSHVIFEDHGITRLTKIPSERDKKSGKVVWILEI